MWPEWWDWELDCENPHLLKRMIYRSFSETDLREMVQNAQGYRPDVEGGRWVLETAHDGKPWEVVVEPDSAEQILLVVTAFAAG